MKLLRFVSYAVVGWCMLLFLYGAFAYPDAPLKPCANETYCGKKYRQYTGSDYANFLHWQSLLFVSWPFGVLAGVLLPKLNSRDKPTESTGNADR